jgi:hypothetical protein
MTLDTFIFTDTSWSFTLDGQEHLFYIIEEAEEFILSNNLNITLRGCLI